MSMTDTTERGETPELRERLAKAALDAAAYDGENDMDGWCTDPYVCEGPVEWDEAKEHWRDNGRRIVDAVLAGIAAAGLGIYDVAIADYAIATYAGLDSEYVIVEAGTLERLRAFPIAQRAYDAAYEHWLKRPSMNREIAEGTAMQDVDAALAAITEADLG